MVYTEPNLDDLTQRMERVEVGDNYTQFCLKTVVRKQPPV
jgi:hypothetical protein